VHDGGTFCSVEAPSVQSNGSPEEACHDYSGDAQDGIDSRIRPERCNQGEESQDNNHRRDREGLVSSVDTIQLI